MVGDDDLQQFDNGPRCIISKDENDTFIDEEEILYRLDTLRNMTCIISSTFLG